MRILIAHNLVSRDSLASDHDVLVQADAISAALARLGHEVSRVACSLDLKTARRQVVDEKPVAIFNLVESLGGSDWLAHVATSLWDSIGIPYTGACTESLLLTNHKLLAKRRLWEAGLPTPHWVTAGAAGLGQIPQQKLHEGFVPGSSYIIKTIYEHASVGVDDTSIVRAESLPELLSQVRQRAERLGRPCFAERYIDGREFNLAVLAGPVGPEVMPPAEIDFSQLPPDRPRIVGYDAKWLEESLEYVAVTRTFDVPTHDDALVQKLQDLSRQCWDLFGLAGYARVDFRVDSAGRPWILEVNANPCLSPDAGFAAALEQAGIPYHEAMRRILEDAFSRQGGKESASA